MRVFLVGIGIAMLSLVHAASAEQRVVVVELFTSQGCSACPPADALLAEIGQRDDVIALALHVDYWDYIGWADRFADPAFSRRQKGYAMAGGWRRVYTPQIVVNGREPVVGSLREPVLAAIDAHAAQTARAQVSMTRSADTLSVTVTPVNGPVGTADIHVVRYTPREAVEIARGENAGRDLTYTHIVRDWTVATRWTGDEPTRLEIRSPGPDPVVVLVQAPDQGPIFAAARLR